jgi:hypothetical protein
VTAEEDHEIMAEKNLEDNTISPESGISSSSPLSWQQDPSPSLPATDAQSHIPLASQVSQSLSQWPGHASDHEDSEAAGWATQVEAEVDTSKGRVTAQQPPVQEENQHNKTENKFNHAEIVNFVSRSWSNVSEDDEVQVYRVSPVKANWFFRGFYDSKYQEIIGAKSMLTQFLSPTSKVFLDFTYFMYEGANH